jgi:NAD(P)-dependent dehydrogenase (short-subunit alcohol dehydrogenase family)
VSWGNWSARSCRRSIVKNGYVTDRDIERNTTTVTQERVLVTGGSGFIAGHCILQLLEQGYVVRTTVRSSKRESAVRAVLTDAGMANGDALTFAEADPHPRRRVGGSVQRLRVRAARGLARSH